MRVAPPGRSVASIVATMRICIWVAIGATLVATVAGWFALGAISDQITRGADAGVSTLHAAVEISSSSNEISTSLDDLAATIVSGTTNVAEVTTLVVDITDQIANLAEGVGGFVSAADDAAKNLRRIQTRVEGAHESLVDGIAQLEDIARQLSIAADDLDGVPDQLRHAESQLATVRDNANRGLWLQRISITIGAAAVIAGLVAFERLAGAITTLLAPEKTA